MPARRRFSRRLSVTSAIAAGGHLLLLAFLAARPAPRAAPPPDPPVVDDGAIAVDFDPERPAPRLPEPVPAPAQVAAPASAPAAPRRALATAPISVAAEKSTAAPAGAGDGPLSSSPVAEAAPTTSAPSLPDALPPPLLPRALHAPPAVLDAPLGTRQGEAGTGASGQVTAAVRRAADLQGPRQGHGVVRITVAADGTVSGVVASGVGWDAAAQAIRAALAGRRLRVPGGGRGLSIAFAVDAVVTRTPPVLTGEARAEPMGKRVAEGTAPPIYDSNRGMGIGAPNMAVIDPRALAPLTRRVVKMELLSEQPR